ncbi:MAG: hypothetical protein R3218_06820 [Christiangramia sp.]|nr:hypothetical protein [Christiangramia sp.]
MLNLLNIPLVNWSLGTGLILFFGVVCLALILIVNHMIRNGGNKNQ